MIVTFGAARNRAGVATRYIGAMLACVGLLVPSVASAASGPQALPAASWLVLDAESGQTLVEHNADEARQPASLTKLMTAYIVLQELKAGTLRLDDSLKVSADIVGQVQNDEARMYLTPGELVTVKKLLEGLIAASANDAALTLAVRVAGSVEGFEQRMSETARSIGMVNSHFATPSGVTTPGNYSTARDLAVLALRLTKDFPEYYRYSSEQFFSYGNYHKRNKNWLLGKDHSVDGLKTGRTKAAGFCIVATAKRQQRDPSMARRIFVVVMGAPTADSRIKFASELLETGFSQFRDYPKGGDAKGFVSKSVGEAGA